VWAAGHLRKSMEVTASGPYRWISHPLYFGSAVMGVGLAIACANPSVAVVIVLYLAIALPVAAKREERILRGAFGDTYDRYQSGAVNSMQRFSWQQVKANHEHRAIVGLAIAIGLLIVRLRLR
jgi:steroid 5-alpha reductase family enzyme